MLTDTLESSVQRKSGEETMKTENLSPDLLHKMDAYWRAGQGLARAKRFVK
jgi:phosphoketolase